MTEGSGVVAGLWRFPVKSLQGLAVETLRCTATGIDGDRQLAIVHRETGLVLSAKTVPELLDAEVVADAEGLVIRLPDGRSASTLDRSEHVDEMLSDWLGRPVTLRWRRDHTGGGYEMTFDPPNDDAETYEIPVAGASFADLAPVHLLTTATLEHARSREPSFDWHVRRFRPNILLDVDGPPFMEDSWAGGEISVGEARLAVSQPTVRCALPLRAQPGLPRARGLYRALDTLHANHLGVYASIAAPGRVSVGDAVTVP